MTVATVVDEVTQDSKLIGYLIQSGSKVSQIDIKSLKRALSNNSMLLTNYKLTSDNRLIRSESDCTYWLMNKDKKVAEFNLENDEFIGVGKLPYNFQNIRNWLNRRMAYTCVDDANAFYKSIGIKSVDKLVEQCYCISLRDSFWVKHQNCQLTWERVSPFRNHYSNGVSTYSMSRQSTSSIDDLYSPDLSTPGSFPHTWKMEDGTVAFLKAGSKYTLGGINSGMEPYSEYYASKVCDYLKFNHVDYDLAYYKRNDASMDLITTCKCFTSEQYGSVSAYDLGLKTYENVIEYCKKLSKHAYESILDMLFLDCLLVNTDRHMGNIEFIMNNDTLEVVDIAPIFDNNYSLLPRFLEPYDVFSLKDYKARDDRTFDDLYRLILNHKSFEPYLQKLVGFKLVENTTYRMRAGRIIVLNYLIETQTKYWLDFEKNNKQ